MKYAMFRRVVCSAVAAFAGLAFPALAATKTVAWSLPVDWESNVVYGESGGRLAIGGGELSFPSEPAGAPALPFLNVSIPVPRGSAFSNCTVEATWVPVESTLRPAIIQQPHVVGETVDETPENPQYWRAPFCPATPEAQGGVQTFAGESTLVAWVTPYRWNGTSGTLEKAVSLRLTFTYVTQKARLSLSALSTTPKVDMVIVSPPAFTNLWKAYVDYRKTTHANLNIVVKNTAEIYAEYAGAGGDDALKIHKYLEAMYDNDNGIKYAILGAGCAKNSSYDKTKEIPIRNNVAAGSMYYASDLYYSCMETKGGKEVWDYNGDGVYLGYKKSGGGYGCDTADQVDWTPEIACFRFPVREQGRIVGIASKNTVTYTAEQQVNGLVAKLRRVEGQGGLPAYTGDFKAGISGKQTFSAWGRGNTSGLIAGECSFFDWQTNPWSAQHAASVDDWEYETRYDIKQYVATGRPLAQVYCGSSDGGTGAQIYGNDLDMDIHVSHGQKQTAAPFEAYNFFTTTKIQKIMNFSFSCQTGHLDTDDFGGNGNLCFAEGCVLNPNGGALVTMNNTREGWGAAGGYHEILSMLIQICMSEAFYSRTDGTAADAFIAGHNRILQRAGGINPSSTMAGCYVEMNTMGDPLAKLCNINAKGTFGPAVGGWFLKDATATNDVSFTGASGSLNLSVTPAASGDTVTIGGNASYKVFNKVTVNTAEGRGHLVWNAPGGFARNGIEFTGGRGDLTFEGDKVRYFGPHFTNVGNIRVNGSGVTLDFDKTGSVRDITSLSFAGGGNKSNAIRSREGGIFKDGLTIPVMGSTLWLQTMNVGGVADKRAAAPLFALTNSTLRIDENPHWATEFLSRSITMNRSTINVNYQSVGFGPAVNNAGFNLYALEGTNYIAGSYDAEISGVFRVDVAADADLKISVPLTKSARTGSLVKVGEGTLELRAANAFTGGIGVREGAVVFGKEALTSSACGEVTVEGGATLRIEALPLASVTKLTVREGGTLILPGEISKSSYLLVDPLVGSLNFEEGALVYNEHDLEHPLQGSTTSDGYFMDTSSFLHWQDANGTWAKGASGTKWLRSGEEEVDYADGNSVMFPNCADETRTIGVSGVVAPDYITFNNTASEYVFTNATADAKISVENLYTVGATRFEPALSVGAKMAVTAGKTTIRDATVASATVSPEGIFHVEGTLGGVTYIKSVTVNVTAYPGETWPGLGTRYKGYQFNGIRFYADGKPLAIPGGTSIAVSGKFNGATASDGATVQGVREDGTIVGYDGTQAVAQILDGSASTGWGGPDGGNTFVQSSGSCTVTITFGSPVRMFGSYALAGGNTSPRSPKNWTVSVTPNGASSAIQVDSRSCGTGVNSWWTSPAISYAGGSSSAAALDVASGGALYLDGTFETPIAVGSNSTLAVTNASCLKAQNGFSLSGEVALDVREAAKAGWTKVLDGANLAATDLVKFKISDGNAAAKIEGGNLYVATEGVLKGPYTRSVGGMWNWNAEGWKADGKGFGAAWADVITRASDDMMVTVLGSSTGTVDCAVSGHTIGFTNAADSVQNLCITGAGPLTCSTLDFSGLTGTVRWEPNLNGANVIAGANEVHLTNGDGGTLNVASNGFVSTVGTFSRYDIAKESRLHFANAGRTLAMGKLPSCGVLSFDGMTLDSGVQGAFQRPDVTYRVEAGQSLTLTDATGFNARMQSSFDIRGGSVTVNPGGAWWFGQNGITTYEQTGGTLTCNATGTTIGNSGSGVVFGYQGESSFMLAVNVASGKFLIPNAVANVWNATTFTLGAGGLLQAKGVGTQSGAAGIVNVNEGGTLEVGAVGLTAAGMTCNLYGGTITGYEAGAKIDADIALGSRGTLAAKGGATLTMNGTFNADGATLNIGTADYTGTVYLDHLPNAITNVAVSGGTWDMGRLRPANAVLTRLDGTVAVTLSAAELRQATGIALFRTTVGALQVKRHLKVRSATGVPVTASVKVKDGQVLVDATVTAECRKWGNMGDAETHAPGVVSGTFDRINYTSFTWRLSDTSNISPTTLAADRGPVKIVKAVFVRRDNDGNPVPASLTLSQGTKRSVGAITFDASSVRVYGPNYPANPDNFYTRTTGSFVAVFDDDTVFDATKDITVAFSGQTGVCVMKPANGTLKYGAWSPCFTFEGYNVGEGDSVSVNVIGGNKGLAGKRVADGNLAGVIPTAGANWNQVCSRSDNSAFDTRFSNLNEVKADGSVGPSAMAARIVGKCTYAANGTTPSGGNAELAFGYVDDGATAFGYATVVLENIPYAQYDVYVYMGTDKTASDADSFGPVSVTDGTKTTVYPVANTAWGSANSTHGTVVYEEGKNYLRIPGCTGATLKVVGSANGSPSGTRCGLAGVQIVNRGSDTVLIAPAVFWLR